MHVSCLSQGCLSGTFKFPLSGESVPLGWEGG